MEKSIVRNYIYKIILNLFNIIIPIVLMPYVYRIISPFDIGKLNYIESIIGYFIILGSFGIYNYGIREVSHIKKEKVKKIILELFTIGSIANLLMLLIYFICIKNSLIIREEFMKTAEIMALMIVANLFNIEWANEALENYRFISYKTIVVKSINFILIFMLVRTSLDYYKYLFILSLGMVINNLVSFIYIINKFEINLKKIIFINILEIKKYLKPLVIILILTNAGIFYTQLDKIILGKNNKLVDLANYSLNQKISTLVYTFVVGYIVVSIPKSMKYINNKKYDEYKKLVLQSIDFISFSFSYICFSSLNLSKIVLFIFGGVNYLELEIGLNLFFVYIFLISLEYIISNQILFLLKKEKIIVYTMFFCGVLNLIMKMIIGIKINYINTILTTIISEIFLILLLIYFVKKKTELKITFEIFKIIEKYLLKSLFSYIFTIVIFNFFLKEKDMSFIQIDILKQLFFTIFFIIFNFSKLKKIFIMKRG